MLLLSCVTDEISQDITKALDTGLMYGVRNFEIRTVKNRRFPFLYDDDIDTIKQFIDNKSIIVSAVSPGIFKLDDFTKLSDHDKDIFIGRVFTLAKSFGTNRVIIFASRQCNEMTDSIKQFCRAAQNEDFFVYLENSAGTCAKSASDTLEIINKTGADNLMINWDPGNAQICGCLDLYEDYKLQREYIGNIHIKDVAYDEHKKPFFVPIGKGVINYEDLIDMILNDGYNSYVTIETHCKPSYPAFVESVSYMHKLIFGGVK